MYEILLVVLVASVVILLPLATLTLAIVALVRVNRLSRQLQAYIEGMPGGATEPEAARAPDSAESLSESEIAAAGAAEAAVAERMPQADTGPAEPFQWELFVGRRALGWVAVALFILAAAFFLRYAYENNWIGPVGRVTIGCVAGSALLLSGFFYDRGRGQLFSRMLSATGVVVLYLSFYAAFGFYHLLPQKLAGVFLVVLVVESATLAVCYGSLGIALTAILGGLLTPVLMYSPQDQYIDLFIYLAALNVGVIGMLLVRSWPAVGTLGLLGTQALFWIWYHDNYHPEKFDWTIGFQSVIFGLYLVHTLGVNVVRSRQADWEDLLRLVLNGFFFFLAAYALLQRDYDPWMGSLAVGMALFYAMLSLWMTTSNPRDVRQTLTALALAAGFVAAAFPIQAQAGWVSLGWAVEAALLWWFGQRISVLALRLLGGGLAGAAVIRLLVVDLPNSVREPFTPIFNEVFAPALGAVLVLMAGLAVSERFLPRRHQVERMLVRAAGAGGVILLWYLLSVECYDYFEAWAHVPGMDRQEWLWRGQLALSILWAVYSLAVLSVGFWRRQADFALGRDLSICCHGSQSASRRYIAAR